MQQVREREAQELFECCEPQILRAIALDVGAIEENGAGMEALLLLDEVLERMWQEQELLREARQKE